MCMLTYILNDIILSVLKRIKFDFFTCRISECDIWRKVSVLSFTSAVQYSVLPIAHKLLIFVHIGLYMFVTHLLIRGTRVHYNWITLKCVVSQSCELFIVLLFRMCPCYCHSTVAVYFQSLLTWFLNCSNVNAPNVKNWSRTF